MNAAVLKTQTTCAISNFIQGWYGNANLLAAPAAFQQYYFPLTDDYSRAGQTALCSDMFKQSCRMCHVSRDDRTRQVDSWGEIECLGFGLNSVCGTGMGMPHSQRVLGIFRGGRGANKPGATSVPNLSAIPGNSVTPAHLCREWERDKWWAGLDSNQ